MVGQGAGVALEVYTCPLEFLMDTILADLRNAIRDDVDWANGGGTSPSSMGSDGAAASTAIQVKARASAYANGMRLERA